MFAGPLSPGEVLVLETRSHKISQDSPKIPKIAKSILKVSQNYPKIISKLSQNYPKSIPKVSKKYSQKCFYKKVSSKNPKRITKNPRSIQKV